MVSLTLVVLTLWKCCELEATSARGIELVHAGRRASIGRKRARRELVPQRDWTSFEESRWRPGPQSSICKSGHRMECHASKSSPESSVASPGSGRKAESRAPSNSSSHLSSVKQEDKLQQQCLRSPQLFTRTEFIELSLRMSRQRRIRTTRARLRQSELPKPCSFTESQGISGSQHRAARVETETETPTARPSRHEKVAPVTRAPMERARKRERRLSVRFLPRPRRSEDRTRWQAAALG